mmetsp:Transcript_21090/g.58421  ORF Transcript_21090/g.58421 Transcript_21090/m.58421 type:complete len:173 (+) Transcript_21090:1285-1803(+)
MPVMDDDDWDGLEDVLDGFFATTPELLSKVWRISHEEAKGTLDTTSSNLIQPSHAALTTKCTSNDRMLRYKRINEYSYMDTFFAKERKGRSTRGHTCCQLFVMDKGFVYVVSMRRKGDLMASMKEFVKEVSTSDAFVCDHSAEQTSMTLAPRYEISKKAHLGQTRLIVILDF